MPASAPFPPPLPLPARRIFRQRLLCATWIGSSLLPRLGQPSLPPVPSARQLSSVPWPMSCPTRGGLQRHAASTRRGHRSRRRSPPHACRARASVRARRRSRTSSLPRPRLGAGRTPQRRRVRVPRERVCAPRSASSSRTSRAQCASLCRCWWRPASPVPTCKTYRKACGAAASPSSTIDHTRDVGELACAGRRLLHRKRFTRNAVHRRDALALGGRCASWRWHVTPREKGKKRLQLFGPRRR